MQEFTASNHKRRSAKRVAIYVRVSSDKQEKNYSLQSQIEGCIKYAEEQGYIVSEEHVYREVKTGTIYRERPELTTLRIAARNREFDIVIVYDLDRLSRDPEHQTVILEDLAYNGVKLECVLRKIEDTPEGKLMLSILGYTAAREIERIRERTMRGRKERATLDKKLTGQGPARYGFKYNENRSKYIPNEKIIKIDESDGFRWTEAAVVRKAFSMSFSGVTLRKITLYLIEKGVPTRKGKLWHPSTIQSILADPYYIGEAEVYRYVYLPSQSLPHKKHTYKRPKDERISLPEGIITPLVDKEIFYAVQERLRNNQRFAERNNEKDRLDDTFLRCGYVVCGYCGSHMSVKREKRKGELKPDMIRYNCHNGTNAIGRCKGANAILTEKLNKEVWKYITEIIRNPSLVEDALKARQQQPNTIEDELAPIERSITKIEQSIRNYNRVIERAEDDDVVDDAVAHLRLLSEKKRNLERDKNVVLQHKKDIVKEQNDLEKFKQWCIEYREKINDPNYEPDYEEKRTACEKLGILVTVWRTDHKPRFKIEANPPDIVSRES